MFDRKRLAVALLSPPADPSRLAERVSNRREVLLRASHVNVDASAGKGLPDPFRLGDFAAALDAANPHGTLTFAGGRLRSSIRTVSR